MNIEFLMLVLNVNFPNCPQAHKINIDIYIKKKKNWETIFRIFHISKVKPMEQLNASFSLSKLINCFEKKIVGMNFKLLLVLFLATSLLVSMSDAGKDRRKKQKQKERQEDDDNNDEPAGGSEMGESGKAKDEKERTSVLEKQAGKKGDDESSSSEEDKEDEDEKKDNSTVIIREENEIIKAEKELDEEKVDQFRQSRVLRFTRSADEARVLPTDAAKFKRDTITQTLKSKELNDGVQLPLDKKPTATASTN
nr:hypothetical protein F09B9.4 - Caenorhabditis elegans [Caenorhabditis elegans]